MIEGTTINKDNFEFSKVGIQSMINELQEEYNDFYDECEANCDNPHFDDTFEIVIFGKSINIPLNADNCNAIECLLKEMCICQMTGEETMGNTTVIFDSIQKRFDDL